MNYFAVGFTIAFAAFGSAIAQGLASKAALERMARQPEATGNIRTTLLLSMAFMESLTLFSFVIAILIWTKI